MTSIMYCSICYIIVSINTSRFVIVGDLRLICDSDWCYACD